MMQTTAAENPSIGSTQPVPAPALGYSIVILSAAVSLYFALVDRAGVFLFVDEFHSLANLPQRDNMSPIVSSFT